VAGQQNGHSCPQATVKFLCIQKIPKFEGPTQKRAHKELKVNASTNRKWNRQVLSICLVVNKIMRTVLLTFL
jgi:hypothetical protein